MIVYAWKCKFLNFSEFNPLLHAINLTSNFIACMREITLIFKMSSWMAQWLSLNLNTILRDRWSQNAQIFAINTFRMDFQDSNVGLFMTGFFNRYWQTISGKFLRPFYWKPPPDQILHMYGIIYRFRQKIRMDEFSSKTACVKRPG